MTSESKLETAFDELITQISNVFPKKQGCTSAKKYLTGLLNQIEHKNNRQIAETIGETTPYKLQQFPYQRHFSADKLKNHLQTYVNKKLDNPNGVIVVDETGFLKQRKHSCRVKHQNIVNY